MNKKTIITVGLVVGGGYLTYWYLTNYGPSGAVTAPGQSWWDQWFGTAAPQVASGYHAPVATGSPVLMTTPETTAVNVAASAQVPESSVQTLRQLVTAAAAPETSLNIDGWSYYVNQVTGKPLSPQTVDIMLTSVSTRDTKVSLDQYIQLLTSALQATTYSGYGVGDIVPASFNMSPGMGSIIDTSSVPTAETMPTAPILTNAPLGSRRPARKPASPWGNVPAIVNRKEWVN